MQIELSISGNMCGGMVRQYSASAHMNPFLAKAIFELSIKVFSCGLFVHRNVKLEHSADLRLRHHVEMRFARIGIIQLGLIKSSAFY